MTSKKAVCTILVILMSITLLLPALSASAEGPSGTLRMWIHEPSFEAPTKAAIAGYVAKNPNATIELEVKTADSYYALLNTAIQAGDPPDVFWNHGTKTSDLGNLVAMNAVMDLTDKVDFAAFDPLATSILQVDGKSYTTPGPNMDTRFVYYNKDIFEQNGFAVPQTFSEFEALCDELVAKGIQPISVAAADSWGVLFTVEPMLAAMGTSWLESAQAGNLNMSDPVLLATLKKYEEWAQKGYFGKNYLAVDGGGMILNFAKGNAAMCITGSWVATAFTDSNPDLKLGAFYMPATDGARPQVVTYSTGFSGSPVTKNPDLTLDFLRYMASTEALQLEFDILGGVPSTSELVSNMAMIREMETGTVSVDSFYNLIGLNPKDGQSPRKLWEEDSVKWVGGSLSAEDLLAEITEAIQPAA